MNSNRAKGICYLLITAIIWGGSFISQLFGGEAIGAFSFNGYRCVLGCITIAIMILFDSKAKVGRFIFFRDDEDVVKTIKDSTLCGVTLFLAMIIQQIGVQRTDTAKAGLITSLEVICVPILLLILYKRKIKLITWIFILTTMFGIMLLSINSLSGINDGDILVAISSVLYSITIIQVTKYVNGIDPLKFSFFRFVIVGILGFIGAMFFRERFYDIAKIKSALPSIFYSGILGTGIAYTFSIIGQHYCEPIIATLIMSLEGIFAAIFGWIILGQSLNLIQIFGILVAFISITMVQITDNIISIIVIDKNSQSNQNQIKEKTYIPDELKYVEVLTTTNETGTDIENIDKKESDKIYQTITVLVNAEQAKLIADAETNKQIYVSLVYRQGNKEVANYLLKRQSDMLAIKYPKSEDDYQTEEDIKSILLDKNEDENKSDTDNNTSLKEINEVLKRKFVDNENEEYLDDGLNYDNENSEETEETETSSMIKDTTQVEMKETRNIEQEEYERIKKEYGVN